MVGPGARRVSLAVALRKKEARRRKKKRRKKKTAKKTKQPRKKKSGKKVKQASKKQKVQESADAFYKDLMEGGRLAAGAVSGFAESIKFEGNRARIDPVAALQLLHVTHAIMSNAHATAAALLYAMVERWEELPSVKRAAAVKKIKGK